MKSNGKSFISLSWRNYGDKHDEVNQHHIYPKALDPASNQEPN